MVSNSTALFRGRDLGGAIILSAALHHMDIVQGATKDLLLVRKGVATVGTFPTVALFRAPVPILLEKGMAYPHTAGRKETDGIAAYRGQVTGRPVAAGRHTPLRLEKPQGRGTGHALPNRRGCRARFSLYFAGRISATRQSVS